MNTDPAMQLSGSKWIQINDFLLSVTSTESIRELNNIILEDIQKIVPFGNSGILIELGENFRPVIKQSVNTEKRWSRMFNEYYYSISNYPEFDKNIFYANCRESKRIHNSEYYNDFLKPQDIGHVTGFMINAGGGSPTHTIVLSRDRSERMYNDEELSVMKMIQPHISNHYKMLSMLEEYEKLPVLISEIENGNELLSERESQIIKLLLQRQRPAEIAKDLSISILTVRKHIQNIYEKLNVTDKNQLLQKIYHNYSKNIQNK